MRQYDGESPLSEHFLLDILVGKNFGFGWDRIRIKLFWLSDRIG